MEINPILVYTARPVQRDVLSTALRPSCRLEDGIHDITSNTGTRAENRRIPQLLAKLLAHIPRLAPGRLSATLLLIRHRHRRRSAIIRVLLRRRRRISTVDRLCRCGVGSLLVVGGVNRRRAGQGLDVGAGEDALGAGAVVAAHPPVGVHVLIDVNGVAALEADVAGVGGGVGVEGLGVGDDGLGGGRGRGPAVVAGGEGGGRGGGGLVVGGWGDGGGVVVVQREVVEGVGGWWRGDLGGDDGHGGGGGGRGAGAVEGGFGGEEGVDGLVGLVGDDVFLKEGLEFLDWGLEIDALGQRKGSRGESERNVRS